MPTHRTIGAPAAGPGVAPRKTDWTLAYILGAAISVIGLAALVGSPVTAPHGTSHVTRRR